MLISIATSCSNKDAAFCECMSAGGGVDDYAQDLMEGEATKEQATKLKDLRTKKDIACASYETMDGPTMIEKKKACEE